jgi:hypothetical protein
MSGRLVVVWVAVPDDSSEPPAVFVNEACGERMVPDELELALHLGLSELPIVREYERVHANKEASQRRSLGWAESSDRHTAGTLASMELAAIDDMRRERWEACRSNRLQALKPAPTPLPF